MRTVVFDLDGTLADTSADLIAAANAGLAGLGGEGALDPAADAATAFRGGRAMLRLGLGRLSPGAPEAEVEATIDRLYPALLDHYRDRIDVETRLYPGAMEAVEALKAAGFAVAICTNKPTDLAELLLARLGVRDAFAGLVGAGCLPVRKPDPAPFHEAVARAGGARGRALLVGDTVTDRDTARAAGAPVVLVTFGPEGDAVAELAPDALLPAYGDLPGLAARLLGD
jgi:phosphoglycolate phosphatase